MLFQNWLCHLYPYECHVNRMVLKFSFFLILRAPNSALYSAAVLDHCAGVSYGTFLGVLLATLLDMRECFIVRQEERSL